MFQETPAADLRASYPIGKLGDRKMVTYADRPTPSRRPTLITRLLAVDACYAETAGAFRDRRQPRRSNRRPVGRAEAEIEGQSAAHYGSERFPDDWRRRMGPDHKSHFSTEGPFITCETGP